MSPCQIKFAIRALKQQILNVSCIETDLLYGGDYTVGCVIETNYEMFVKMFS